jgi:hypothetical protein
MKNITFHIDTSGFSYDAENPTINMERLAYAELQILQAISTEGFNIRQVSGADILSARSGYSEWIDSLHAEEPPETPDTLYVSEDMDEIISCGVNPLIAAESSLYAQNLLREQDNESSLSEIPDAISSMESAVVVMKESLVEQIGFLVAEDSVLELGDGSRILWKSGVVDF